MTCQILQYAIGVHNWPFLHLLLVSRVQGTNNTASPAFCYHTVHLAYETLNMAPTTVLPYRYPPDCSGKSFCWRLGPSIRGDRVVFRDKCGAIDRSCRVQPNDDWVVRNIFDAVRLCTVDNTASRSSTTDYPACEDVSGSVTLPKESLEHGEIRAGDLTSILRCTACTVQERPSAAAKYLQHHSVSKSRYRQVGKSIRIIRQYAAAYQDVHVAHTFLTTPPGFLQRPSCETMRRETFQEALLILLPRYCRESQT